MHEEVPKGQCSSHSSVNHMECNSVKQHARVHLTPGMELAHVKAKAEADSTILSIYNSNLLRVSVTSLPLQCRFFLLIDQQMLKLQHQAIQAEQLYFLY